MRNTAYCQGTFREYAPNKSDCLTAVHYIFKKSANIDIPLTFIGDMPRRLFFLREWSPIDCNIANTQCGDIFFTKNKNKPRLISHVALVINPDKIFHCTPLLQKAVVQSKEEFFSFYEQSLSLEKMICYVDPRNKTLRSEKGIFIPVKTVAKQLFGREIQMLFVV